MLRVCRKLTSPSFKILQSCIVGIHQPTSPSLTKVPHIFQLQPTTRILSSACPTHQSARIKNIFSQQVLFPPPGQAAGSARNEKPTTSSKSDPRETLPSNATRILWLSWQVRDVPLYTAVWTRIEMCRDFFVKASLTFFLTK